MNKKDAEEEEEAAAAAAGDKANRAVAPLSRKRGLNDASDEAQRRAELKNEIK
ncbi:hypothetical protein M419DRAFT_119124 [Trichoderma reesei RUT C-30]|jgi:hypothetical protein|uniref:Uncharacterized protein n=1 Tax=Hypocrea jecorina (strain ATCC 56765 / BCRC 32924 / NRRL 11460 / Rut C-30) TaxID=1344414 RepID=A0A024S998_HYPJR|nr:hypothetical protein M419DRAFT_119124 [Trichoderma reesei RUT C-30]